MAPGFAQHAAGSREARFDRQAWSGAAVTHPPRHAAASADVDVKDVLNEMQSNVYQRGVRVKDCFADFDPLRSGRCTPSQFVRGVNRIVPSLKVSDGEALADHYTDKGPLIKVPQTVNYQKFSTAVNEVFGVERLEKYPTFKPPRPGSAVQSRRNPQQRRALAHAEPPGSDLAPKEQGPPDAEPEGPPPASARPSRAPQPAAPAPNSARGASAPRRPLSGCSARSCAEPQTAISPDEAAAALRAADEEVVHKVRAMVQERQLRLHGIFADFDPLRRGFCSMSHVRTACTYLNVLLEEKEFESLKRLYSVSKWDKDDFNYRDFSNDVNELPLYPNASSALSAPEEHADAGKTPHSDQPPSRPQSSRPLSARAGYALGRPASPFETKVILGKICKHIRERRYQLGPFFRDAFWEFDRANRGTMTLTQFQRVMNIQAFPLMDVELKILCQAFGGSAPQSFFRCHDFVEALEKVMAEHTEEQVERHKSWGAQGTPRPLPRWANGSPYAYPLQGQPGPRAASASAAQRRLQMRAPAA